MTRRADWLHEEPFTLVLSAGFFGFFAHTGVLGALEEHGLRPRRVVGASAGALAGGLWAAGMKAADARELLMGLRRTDFWDPGLPLGGLLRGEKFGACLRAPLERVGVESIEECPTPFAAIVHDLFERKTVALERGPLETAIRASCAVPLMFRPVKHGGRWLIDGGVSDRAGFSGLESGERTLYHHLPHRSPWSGIAGPEGAELAAASNRLTLVVEGMPRVTPFRLERGADALALARETALEWLDEPVG